MTKDRSDLRARFRWETINAVLYKLGGVVFIIGSVLFFTGGVFNYWRAYVVMRKEIDRQQQVRQRQTGASTRTIG